MNILRALVFPAVLATPLWLAAMRILTSGWSAIGDLDWGLDVWIFGLSFTLPGLLLIGLPAAFFVRRCTFSPAIKVLLLLAIGALGGGVIAMIYMLGITAMSGTLANVSWEIFLIAPFGALPGVVVASVWVSLNFGWLRRGSRNG